MKKVLLLFFISSLIFGCATLQPKLNQYGSSYSDAPIASSPSVIETIHPLDRFNEVDGLSGNPDEIISVLSQYLDKQDTVILYFEMEGTLRTFDKPNVVQPLDVSIYESEIVNTLVTENIKRTLKESFADIIVLAKLIEDWILVDQGAQTATVKFNSTYEYRLVEPKTYTVIAANTYTFARVSCVAGPREGEYKIVTKEWK